MPVETRRYRMLGRTIRFSCDRPGLLRRFDADYGCFRKAGDGPRASLVLRAHLTGRRPRLEIVSPRSGRVLALPSVRIPFVFDLVQREVLRALPNFIFLHAAVAVRDGAALVVSGPSGAGKSTLLLELVKAGFDVFSDEFCPIHLRTLRVHPFPRAVTVRVPGRKGPVRRPVDLPSLGRALGRAAVPLRQLAFLETATAGPARAGLHVLIESGRGESLLKEAGRGRLKTIPGAAYEVADFPAIADKSGRILLCRALNARREAVLYIHRRVRKRGAFSARPAARVLRPDEAARLVLANLIDSSNDRMLARPGAAFFQVCGLLKNAVCLSLRPGTPGATAELLTSAWAGRDPGLR